MGVGMMSDWGGNSLMKVKGTDVVEKCMEFIHMGSVVQKVEGLEQQLV